VFVDRWRMERITVKCVSFTPMYTWCDTTSWRDVTADMLRLSSLIFPANHSLISWSWTAVFGTFPGRLYIYSYISSSYVISCRSYLKSECCLRMCYTYCKISYTVMLLSQDIRNHIVSYFQGVHYRPIFSLRCHILS